MQFQNSQFCPFALKKIACPKPVSAVRQKERLSLIRIGEIAIILGNHAILMAEVVK
mgnify:CR=1 FL=1